MLRETCGQHGSERPTLASLAQSWFPADLAGHGLAEAACRHCLGDRGEVFDVLRQAGLLVPSGLDGEFSIAPRALGEHLAGAGAGPNRWRRSGQRRGGRAGAVAPSSWQQRPASDEGAERRPASANGPPP
ncbi:MAG: hypothetical protein M5U09_22630 [Gammaproteobacteria bacterium]|nr:hypothetical protein [Gammaproteobacteria bacterium]